MSKNRIKTRRAPSDPVTTNQPAQASVTISQMSQISVDRSPKDVKTWRDSHKSAESIHYPNRTRLYDLYSDVELDTHLMGIWGRRSDTVINKTLKFYRNGKHAEEFDTLIATNEFDELMKGILYSKMQGMYGFEFIPGEDFRFEVIPRKHIKPEKHIITINQSDQEGTNYDAVDNIWVVGKDKDLGLLLLCSFYALLKKGNFSDWSQYIEIFGQPLRVIYYDANDDGTKIELQKVLQESGGSLVMMIPTQAKFEIMDGKTSNGDGQLQERFKTACNSEMNTCLLGVTDMDSGGSYGKEKEKGKQQLEITKSDMKFLRNLLNSKKFLGILKSYGYNTEGGGFLFDKELDIYALQSRAAIDTIVSQQVPVSDDYWYDTYGIPKPDNYPALRKKMDEEKAAQNAPPEQEPAPVSEGGKPAKAKPGTPPKKAKLSAWQELRLKLADFFDPAPGS